MLGSGHDPMPVLATLWNRPGMSRDSGLAGAVHFVAMAELELRMAGHTAGLLRRFRITLDGIVVARLEAG